MAQNKLLGYPFEARDNVPEGSSFESCCRTEISIPTAF